MSARATVVAVAAIVYLALIAVALWYRAEAAQARAERDRARDQVVVVSAAAEACSASVEHAKAVAGEQLAAAHRALEDFKRLHAGQRAAVARLEALLDKPEPPGAGCDAAWQEIETGARAPQR